jgi:hypothetical protein
MYEEQTNCSDYETMWITAVLKHDGCRYRYPVDLSDLC